MNRLSIVHVMPGDGIGGAEVAARSMLARDDLPCDFKLLLMSGEPIETGSAQVIAQRHANALSGRAIWETRRAIRSLAPDTVLFSLWRSVPPMLLTHLTVRPRPRLVLFLHSTQTVHFADRLFSFIGIRIADAVWADSPVTLQKRAVPSGKRTDVVSFVVDRVVPASMTMPPSLRFVSWCRLSAEKGLDRALRLIAALSRRGGDVRYDIWGPDGGEQAALERLTDELGIRRQVAFRGPTPRSSLPEIAAGHSFFMQLSRFEGMAMSVVEAMQLGLVPVTTMVGQMAEYVRPGETGIRVDPADLDAAADAIEAVAKDAAGFSALRERAMAEWSDHACYADDVCRAAALLT